MTVYDNMLGLIGQTPLVKLEKIKNHHNINANLFAKCEFFNAAGSVKDRIALRMVQQAEKQGRITPGKTTLVEASSGNTGVGLAMVSAIKGYRCIITMPEKMSKEKENTIKALGAEIIRTPTEAAHDSPESNMGKAAQLVRDIPGAVMLDQYGNEDNPNAHYYGTAPEILSSLSSLSPSSNNSGKVDVLVAGAGTGGTLTGLSRRLKEENSDTFVVGVDPRGSVLARPESLNELDVGESEIYRVEGIGYDFIPEVLKHNLVDHWVKTTDSQSFAAARLAIRLEGILCGGSSGSAIDAAVRFLKSDEGKRFDRKGVNVVVLLADSIRNYVSSSWLSETDGDEQ
ncbi:cysteine synthase [Meredithblackwellia eburnea MCA 4105]